MPSPYGRHRPRRTSARPSSEGEELLHQRGLPDARRAQDREELTGRVLDRRCERLPQLRELPFAPDHRRVEVPRGRRVDVADPEETPRGDGIAFAFDVESARPVAVRAVADEPVRRFTQQDLARSSVLFEARRDVDGITGDQRLSEAGSPATTPPVLTPMWTRIATPRSRSSSLFEIRESVSHVDDGATRSERVVFVQLRDPEHRHHRVADVLLDRPSVAFDRRAHRVEVAGLNIAE